MTRDDEDDTSLTLCYYHCYKAVLDNHSFVGLYHFLFSPHLQKRPKLLLVHAAFFAELISFFAEEPE